MEFLILGPVEAVDGDREIRFGATREAALLAILVVHAPEVVSAGRLIEDLWRGHPPPGAQATLQGYVRNLRRMLEPGRPAGTSSSVLVTRRPGYLLEVGSDGLDAWRFERLADQGRQAFADAEPARAAACLRTALSLWRGPAFGELGSEPFAAGESARLDERRLVAAEDHIDARLALGRHVEMAGELEVLVAEHPYRERFWAQLLLALYRQGRQADALRAFGRLRRLLGDELGIEPSLTLRALEEAIVLQKPSLDWVRQPAGSQARTGPATTADLAQGPAMTRRAFPAGLVADRGPLVGRVTLLDWLDVLVGRAATGETQGALVCGPRGSGRTRLATEVARRAYHRGATVVDGRAADLAASDLAAVTHPVGSAILVVVDDLDELDAATVLGIHELAAGDHHRPVLFLATASCSAVAPWATARTLGPLDSNDVGKILAFHLGHQVPPDLSVAVHAQTGGNPRMVTDVARRLAETELDALVARAVAQAGVTADNLHAACQDISDGVSRRAMLRAQPNHPAAQPGGSLLCPYKGLAPFETADAAIFFGRDRIITELVARLAQSRIITVVGPSGSGKSSLVRAGLLAALRDGALPGSDAWPAAVFTPGADPLRQLAAALARCTPSAGADADADADADGLARQLSVDPGVLDQTARSVVGGSASDQRLVVVIDQLEELFTAGRHDADRVAFLDAVVDAANAPDGPTSVVFVVRADYYGRLAAFPELVELVSDSQHLVGPMTEYELQAVVEGPARCAGITLEEGLSEAIVADVAGQPGGLPLLSTALLETWVRRNDHVLTHAGYQDAGRVAGALAALANHVYDQFTPDHQAACRTLLMRLVEAGEEDGDIARRAPLSELTEAGPGAEEVLDVLAHRRLLTISDTTAEVAHEALLREWPRLREWLEEDRAGRHIHQQLSRAAAAWDASGRDRDELYRGARLAAASDWLAAHPADLSPLEHRFLTASISAQYRVLAQSRRTAHRLRSLSAGLAVFLVLALLGGAVALTQRARAQHQASVADAARLAAQARALPPERVDLALLLDVAARHIDRSAASDASLEAALAHVQPGLERLVRVDGLAGYPGLSPDGRFLAAATGNGKVDLVELASGRVVRTLSGAGRPSTVSLATFSPDGRLVASGSGEGMVTIWDAATGRPIGPPLRPGGDNVEGKFDPVDPNRLFTVGNGTVLQWDLRDPRRAIGLVRRFPPDPNGINLLSVSPDGRRVAASSYTSAQTYVWDTGSGVQIHAPAPRHPRRVHA